MLKYLRTYRKRSPGQLTLYPVGHTLPTQDTWVLAYQDDVLQPACLTAQGWHDLGGHPLDVRWWTPAPDEATRQGRDVLKVIGGLS